jgi:hypothetical protein
MNFNIWTAKISVAFKIIVFFNTGMFHYLFENMNCTLKKGIKKICTIVVLHVNVGFFLRAIEMHRKMCLNTFLIFN